VSRAVLSIGSNVGDRLAYLMSTVDELAGHMVGVSPVYETEPVGTGPQDHYLNAILIVEAPATEPRDWLDQARKLEAASGRVRTQRWGPRTLDVDVIAVDGVNSDDPDLTLPHPRAHERAFVLVPWLDVEPDARLARHGAVRDLVRRLDTAGVCRRDDLALR
jgi:2-amino-4-hydroxy-6-hydroxymethyldihydropteridine diphosphokinase